MMEYKVNLERVVFVERNTNFRLIANVERILQERNREREKENLPKIRKKDLDSRANDTLYRLRHNLNYPNLSTIMKWANVLDVDISEFFQPI